MRKSAEELKMAFESVAVEMFCGAETAANADQKPKLAKLIKLWENKSIFSASTLNKMRSSDDSWAAYKERLKEDYRSAIESALEPSSTTLASYKQQHVNFVQHANTSIQSQEQQKIAAEEEIAKAEAEVLQQSQQQPQQSFQPANGNGADAAAAAPAKLRSTRSSRWDTGGTKAEAAAAAGPPPGWNTNPGGFGAPAGLPDMSRPPPGFPPAAGVAQMQPPTVVDENTLIPTMPYYDLPAGLMVPLVKLEDSGYKPLDPKKIRLPPPTPPTDRLLQALESFYAPPSHDRPRDAEGWEMIGLYEWSKEKAASIKVKADEIEEGKRERSPTASPDPYAGSGSSTPEKESARSPERQPVMPEDRSRRKQRRSRSRSRTRSRSRGSTPEKRTVSMRRNRSPSRSPSPPGGYSMPSYLTKRSPSPKGRAASPPRPLPPPPPPAPAPMRRRSPSPPRTIGLGSAGASSSFDNQQRLDSSNKGHQMMQRMGWKGTGLGSGEGGITEPVKGGEIRDRSDQYKGVGIDNDPFLAFRKAKSGTFYTKMKGRGDKDFMP
jgi:calcium homeostasis ER protein